LILREREFLAFFCWQHKSPFKLLFPGKKAKKSREVMLATPKKKDKSFLFVHKIVPMKSLCLLLVLETNFG
jgi:hypothetical protein